MINLELSWPEAAITAASLGVVAVALRAADRPRLAGAAVFTQESALIVGLFALWQLAGSFSVLGPSGALARGRWIWQAERIARLPDETSLQRLFLAHRDHYRRMRTTLVVFTSASLLIQLIPVAPPRMLPSTGMVDTGVRY